MQCPACKGPLVILEYDCIEADYCFACEGVWLDAGELELFFTDAQKCASFVNGGKVRNDLRERTRRCPICGKKMRKVATDSQPPVVYDRCPRGDGLWFDKGELAQVLEQGISHKGGDEVAGHLRKIFAARTGSDLTPESEGKE